MKESISDYLFIKSKYIESFTLIIIDSKFIKLLINIKYFGYILSLNIYKYLLFLNEKILL